MIVPLELDWLLAALAIGVWVALLVWAWRGSIRR